MQVKDRMIIIHQRYRKVHHYSKLCTLCPKKLGPLPFHLFVGLAIIIGVDPQRQVAINLRV